MYWLSKTYGPGSIPRLDKKKYETTYISFGGFLVKALKVNKNDHVKLLKKLAFRVAIKL